MHKSVHAYVWYGGVTRYCLRPILIGKVEHILPASHSNAKLCTHTHTHTYVYTLSSSLTKRLSFCSPISGPSVYQSVSCVSLYSGSDLGHSPPRDPEWTHPRIQGDTKTSTYTHNVAETHTRQKQTQTHTHR